ncbi:PilW family protein [Candidatus Omnitrophota bacterium]
MKSTYVQPLVTCIKNHNNQKGFTIVELIVATTISIILGMIILTFMGNQSQKFNEQKYTSEIQLEIRNAMAYISDYVRLAGNGVPLNGKWPVIEGTDGGDEATDYISVMGCYVDVFVETTQNMGSEFDQIEIEDNDDIEVGDLASITDGINQEIFMITGVDGLLLSHETSDPWNESNELDYTYEQGSTISIAASYSFYVEEDEDGRFHLMVETQSIEAQELISDVDDFQIRYQLTDDTWVDEFDSISDISMIEITIIARTHDPIKNYIDPVYGDAFKRVQLKAVVRPKLITEQS